MLEINGIYDLISSQSKIVFTESVYKIDPNSQFYRIYTLTHLKNTCQSTDYNIFRQKLARLNLIFTEILHTATKVYFAISVFLSWYVFFYKTQSTIFKATIFIPLLFAPYFCISIRWFVASKIADLIQTIDLKCFGAQIEFVLDLSVEAKSVCDNHLQIIIAIALLKIVFFVLIDQSNFDRLIR